MEQTDSVSIDRQKINEEVPQLVGVLKEMKGGLDTVTSKVQDLTAKVKENKLSTSEGISYLEAKHLLLISYCQLLIYYLLRKAEGLSIEGHPVVRSLVEIRLFLEKIRPIDKKCRYLIERMLKTSATDAVQVGHGINGAEDTQKSEDPLQFRPNPDNMLGRGADEQQLGPYRPPKITPYKMEEEKDKRTKKEERNDIRKSAEMIRRVTNDSYFKDMMNDAEGKPEEVVDRVGAESKELIKYTSQRKIREQQEEEQFTRAPITKAEKRKIKQLQRSNGLLDLGDFREEFKMLPFEDDDSNTKTRRGGGSSSMERKYNKRKRKH